MGKGVGDVQGSRGLWILTGILVLGIASSGRAQEVRVVRFSDTIQVVDGLGREKKLRFFDHEMVVGPGALISSTGTGHAEILFGDEEDGSVLSRIEFRRAGTLEILELEAESRVLAVHGAPRVSFHLDDRPTRVMLPSGAEVEPELVAVPPEEEPATVCEFELEVDRALYVVVRSVKGLPLRLRGPGFDVLVAPGNLARVPPPGVLRPPAARNMPREEVAPRRWQDLDLYLPPSVLLGVDEQRIRLALKPGETLERWVGLGDRGSILLRPREEVLLHALPVSGAELPSELPPEEAPGTPSAAPPEAASSREDMPSREQETGG